MLFPQQPGPACDLVLPARLRGPPVIDRSWFRADRHWTGTHGGPTGTGPVTPASRKPSVFLASQLPVAAAFRGDKLRGTPPVTTSREEVPMTSPSFVLPVQRAPSSRLTSVRRRAGAVLAAVGSGARLALRARLHGGRSPHPCVLHSALTCKNSSDVWLRGARECPSVGRAAASGNTVGRVTERVLCVKNAVACGCFCAGVLRPGVVPGLACRTTGRRPWCRQ